jgi:cytochrome c-type biogenesis protein CcmH
MKGESQLPIGATVSAVLSVCFVAVPRNHDLTTEDTEDTEKRPVIATSARRGLQFILLAVAVLVFLGAGDEAARVDNLGHRLMCVCGCNQILLECNHVGCQYSDRMRGELIAAVERGDSDDLTLQAFVQKYGTTVMAAPTTKGFNRVAWVMPYLALVLGLMTVVFIVRAWRMRPLAVPGGVAPVTGADLERFREQARKDTEI